jgi:hypothetical protein
MISRLPQRTVLAAALALAALLVAAAPLAAAASSAAPRRATAPPCKTSQLVIWISEAQGTAGSFFYKLNFTNLSEGTCTLRGYPKAHAVDLQGKRIGANATHERAKAKTVTLRGGERETESANLRIVDPGAFSPSECDPTVTAGIRVSPPGQSASKIVPFPSETCAEQPSQSAFGVGPVA